MKKDKKRIDWSEAVMDVVFPIIFYGIGAFIVSLFGVDLGSEVLDSDLLFIIGAAVFLGVVLACCCIVFGIRKIIKNRKK